VGTCQWIAETDNQKIKTYAEGLEEVLGVLVDVEHARLGVLGEVEGGDLGDVLVLALALLFLELERDTADGTTLDTLHQVSGVTGDLDYNQKLALFALEGFQEILTLLRRRLEAMMAISSQMRLLVSKSRVNLG
jgi:hypothetical protein